MSSENHPAEIKTNTDPLDDNCVHQDMSSNASNNTSRTELDQQETNARSSQEDFIGDQYFDADSGREAASHKGENDVPPQFSSVEESCDQSSDTPTRATFPLEASNHGEISDTSDGIRIIGSGSDGANFDACTAKTNDNPIHVSRSEGSEFNSDSPSNERSPTRKPLNESSPGNCELGEIVRQLGTKIGEDATSNQEDDQLIITSAIDADELDSKLKSSALWELGSKLGESAFRGDYAPALEDTVSVSTNVDNDDLADEYNTEIGNDGKHATPSPVVDEHTQSADNHHDNAHDSFHEFGSRSGDKLKPSCDDKSTDAVDSEETTLSQSPAASNQPEPSSICTKLPQNELINREFPLNQTQQSENGANGKPDLELTSPFSSVDEVSSIKSNSTSRKNASFSPSLSMRKGTSIPLKSPVTEKASLLTRGMSLFARYPKETPRPSLEYYQMSTPSLTRYSRNIDDDTNSVSSERSRGVKSISSSLIRPADDDGQEDALMRHLEESGLMLVKRLIEFLSECPPAPEEGRNPKLSAIQTQQSKKQRGMTLPASAIGWLSSQISRSEEETENVILGFHACYQVPIQQLQCLEEMLRRVTSLRISGDAWPPPLISSAVAAASDGVKRTIASIPEKQSISSRILSKFSSDQASVGGDDLDDASCATSPTLVSTRSEKEVPITAFQRYYHEIQHKPDVNMALFPHATKVIIDGIPPGWVSNLDQLKNLEMFQIEKGCILDINELFFPSDKVIIPLPKSDSVATIEISPAENRKLQSEERRLYFQYDSLSKLRLSNCAIGETAGLRGRPKNKPSSDSVFMGPTRLPPMSRFPNLVSLNLSHNELFKTKSALAGLSSLPFLSSINLSYNRLTNMDNVFLHIGNIKELILSGNAISSTNGLDRLFSLERLSLDDNKIQHIANIAGIAKLPFLMNFDLKGNPVEIEDSASCRVKVLNLFRDIRCKSLPKTATYRDMQQLLPILDGEIATKDELVALKDLTFRQAAPMTPEVSSQEVADTRVDESTEFKSIALPNQVHGTRKVTKITRSRKVHLRLEAGDVLLENAEAKMERFHQRIDNLIDNKVGSHVEKELEKKHRTKFKVREVVESLRPQAIYGHDYMYGGRGDLSGSGSVHKRSHSSRHDKSGEGHAIDVSEAPFPYSLPPSLLEEADDDTWLPPADNILVNVTDLTPDDIASEDDVGKSDDDEADLTSGVREDVDIEQEKHHSDEIYRVNSSPKTSTDLSLDNETRQGLTNPFDDFYRDIENQESIHNQNHPPEDSVDLEPSKSVFSGVWEQAYRKSITSNMGSSPNVSSSKQSMSSLLPNFDEEESKAVYDGPPNYSTLYVSSDLDLYFDSFVFPAESNDESQEVADSKFLIPRIQLFKFDRSSLIERTNQSGTSLSMIDFSERYIGVWKEDVLACGPYARMRLPPLKLPRRGFHGDAISRGGKEVTVSDCRKFIVCLSDCALYFILDDTYTKTPKKQINEVGGRRPFPSRIPPNATFGDAYWPHAVMRHSFDCLRGIVIGFQFQRLCLQFSVPSPKGDSVLEYSYVILTSNKMKTISLLQKLQAHTNDARPDYTGEPKSNALIENDDKVFLDALGSKADDVVLHYHILHQIWKRGDREAARRSFVLTSSRVFLLDEMYSGDGTIPDEKNVSRKKLGNISLSVIDSASLSRVSEIRAANEDPRLITLVLHPQNKLKRAHRWRLVCNDGECAERLIDDVRKAIKATPR